MFEDFLDILETKSLKSKEYKKAVNFLEQSLYNEAGFDSLKLLASVYQNKKDFKNQIHVLKVLTVNYPKNPESFYLLAMAYKNLYIHQEVEQVKSCKRQKIRCKSLATEKTIKKCSKKYQTCLTQHKTLFIENINQALKLNSKYTLAYQALLPLLMKKDPKTGEELHTKDSLSLVIDMLKNLRNNKYYIPLCKAYYDTNFLKQSRKACERSRKRNPKDPISPIIDILSHPEDKNTSQKMIQIAGQFKSSFFAQYKTALYFMDKEPQSAITFFRSAHTLKPKHLELNKIMSQFFFDQGLEKEAYKYFLNSCLLTEGDLLRAFKKAQSSLRKKNKADLIFMFQKGIDECFKLAREKKRAKKQ